MRNGSPRPRRRPAETRGIRSAEPRRRMTIVGGELEKYFGTNHVRAASTWSASARGVDGLGDQARRPPAAGSTSEEPTAAGSRSTGAPRGQTRSMPQTEAQEGSGRLAARRELSRTSTCSPLTVLGNGIEAPRGCSSSRRRCGAAAEYYSRWRLSEARRYVPPVGRPETARRHRPCAVHGTEGAPFRRADVGTRP